MELNQSVGSAIGFRMDLMLVSFQCGIMLHVQSGGIFEFKMFEVL